MSKIICIVGESGSGKTTSMRKLDPKETFYIDADKKGLSWKGWKTQYSLNNKNYMATSNTDIINSILSKINTQQKHIKYVVIDTLNGIMIDDEMARTKEKSYDKWMDLATCIYALVSNAHSYRDDLIIIFTAHSQTDREDSGYLFTRIKTSGKKLDKICLESKFTTVLYAKCTDDKYLLETRARNSTAKTPLGAFKDFEIDNDITAVIKALEEY